MKWKHWMLAAAAAAMAVCLTACGGKLPQGTVCLGQELGGMKPEEAVTLVEAAFDRLLGDQTVTLAFGGRQAELSGAAFALSGVSEALAEAREGGSVPVDVVLADGGEVLVNSALEELSGGGTMVASTCVPQEGGLLLTKGYSGITVSTPEGARAAQEQLLTQVTELLAQGRTVEQVVLDGVESQPAEPDLESIYRQVLVEPQDAYLDPEAQEIVPHVDGVSFDIADVRRQLAQAGEGEEWTVDYTITPPETTTEALEAVLFQDVLGEAYSYVSGTSSRASNVALAASFCDGLILMPGDEFSYNGTVGKRSVDRGFKPAPAYVNGETVDEVGGGICQVSSTLYYATLRARLEIVERRNHSYAVGYVPDGMDATVAWNAIDFRFQNNTDYPIMLELTMEGRNLTVRVLGTDTEGYTVKLWNKTLATYPYETIEEEDPTLQPGESKVRTTGYTGRKVEVYRAVYDQEGNLISSDLVTTDTYKTRNKVVLVGPKAEETATPTLPPETPVPSAEVSPTPPAESQPPAESAVPTPPAESPVPSADPVPSLPPETPPPASAAPGQPVESPAASEPPLLPVETPPAA